MAITESTTIKDLTNGEYSSLKYDATGNNYSGNSVSEISNLLEMAGTAPSTTLNPKVVGPHFRDQVLNYQKDNNLPQTGVADDSLLHHAVQKIVNKTDEVVEQRSNLTEEEQRVLEENRLYGPDSYENTELYDAHYDPFFLNNSSKVYRKNHKDIVISMGDRGNVKIIKDVFMRSVSVQVDTSGKPISEVYNFIARDIKESDATEDAMKYIGEEQDLSASSDIKYTYESLFKDP